MAVLLLLTGCSSDDGGSGKGKDRGDSSDSGKDNGSGDSGSTGGSGGTSGKPGDPNGAWMTTVEGNSLHLQITAGQAALVGEHTCAGTFKQNTLNLTCPDGNTDRVLGKVTVPSGSKTLKVSWDAGLEESFTKVPTGDMPSGMPSEMPTGEIPDGEVPGIENP